MRAWLVAGLRVWSSASVAQVERHKVLLAEGAHDDQAPLTTYLENFGSLLGTYGVTITDVKRIGPDLSNSALQPAIVDQRRDLSSCDHFTLAYAGHGSDGYLAPGVQMMSYEGLAIRFCELCPAGTITVVITACQSGTAHAGFGQAFSGRDRWVRLVTSSPPEAPSATYTRICEKRMLPALSEGEEEASETMGVRRAGNRHARFERGPYSLNDEVKLESEGVRSTNG